MSEVLKKLAEQKSLLKPEQPDNGEIVQSVNVPIEIEYQDGTLRCYISLSPKILNSEKEFFDAIESIGSAFKLAVYRKQQSGFKSFGGGSGYKTGFRRY